MKKLLLTTAFIAFAVSANAEILAKVNGRPITRAEVERSLSEVATMEDGADPKLETFPIDFQRAFIDKYIEKLLIVDEARRTGVAKDPDVVTEVKSFEDNLLQQKYLTDLVIKQRTDKKLRDIYAAKFKSKDGKQEAHASHILVKTEEEAKKIKKELDNGADFDEMADKYSIDPGAKIASGDLGYFTAEEKVPEFSKAVFALKKGEISNPVKTDFGWHIIKLYDKRNFKAPAYAEAISDVEGSLASNVIDDEVVRLKKTSKIEYLGDFAKYTPTVAKKDLIKASDEEHIPPVGKTTLSSPKPVATAPVALPVAKTDPRIEAKNEIKAATPPKLVGEFKPVIPPVKNPSPVATTNADAKAVEPAAAKTPAPAKPAPALPATKSVIPAPPANKTSKATVTAEPVKD